MPLPENINGLSPAQLKLLEEVADLQRTVTALREEIARLKGGPGQPNIKPNTKRAVWSRRPIQSRQAAPTSDAGAAARERS